MSVIQCFDVGRDRLTRVCWAIFGPTTEKNISGTYVVGQSLDHSSSIRVGPVSVDRLLKL